MASGKIFIGNIMEDMVSALGSMEESMADQIIKADEQISKMDDQISELQNINSSVAQSVNSIIVKADTTQNEIIMNPSALEGSQNVSSYKCFASGVITITGQLRTGHSSYAASFKISVDGAAATTLFSTINTGFTSFSVNTIVSSGSQLTFSISTTGSNPYLAAGCKITFAESDIMQSGGFIKL